MPEIEVSRILGSSTHYEVLKLEQLDYAPVFANVQQVRRHYKELAILVHPDKNREPDAEAAFKRLSEAYECLVDEISQCNYLQQLQVPQPKSELKTANQKYKCKRKWKSMAKTTQEPNSRKRRSPEEIWQKFQREEEELARQQFHAKGFDRVYDSKRTADVDEAATNSTTTTEQLQSILDSNLDAKATKWAAWSKTTSKRRRVEAPESAQTILPANVPGASSLICCFLCRRKFPTVEALARHETLSKLHLTNVRTQKLGDCP
ncbi:Molecular chaperone DnaJ [Phytophthora palmivora]|uniref:Molecular chaperone DnaJ n=1 Tax=Phytophthora palmivora TaxID=4796 RepID=A0A2P4YI53_9STRA|nr:Molecular chaperone DnaJ [Phytophthora palmivora]